MELCTTNIQCLGIKDSAHKKKIFNSSSNTKVLEFQVRYENPENDEDKPPSEPIIFQTTQSAINKLITEIYNVNLPLSNFSIGSSSALSDISLLCQCISSTPKIQKSLAFVNFIETENNLCKSSTFLYEFIKDSNISGVLTKTKNKNKRTKKERLCAIKYNRILYYFSNNDKKCKGLKFLDDCKVLGKSFNTFQLSFGSNETYLFTTPTTEECEKWVSTINSCIEHIQKSTFQVSGQVQGTLVRGRNLAIKDIGGLSDPFAIIKAERQQYKSHTIYKTLNPTYNENFHFDISKHNSYLYLFLWDEDKFKTDFMGEIIVPLSALPANQEVQLWLPLAPRNSKDKVSGDLLLKLRYFYAPDTLEVSPNAIYGNSLESLKNRPNVCKNSVPIILYQFIEFFEKHGLNEEGIFRICGNSIEIKSIKSQIDQNFESVIFNAPSVHAFAGAFKLFFRELPEPLFTFAQYDNFINLSKQKNFEIQAVIDIMKTFPQSHIATLKLILPFFKKISDNINTNLMGNYNLSIVFGPALLRPQVEDNTNLMEMIVVNEITKFIFDNSQQILKSL
ncbi:hypothetical protein DICPUDRAFT_149424 [Dictyostelium purpureum]|uniref:Uncharacterized protein n=1 Tax=Dictyostelium purpureum TaxID=5786 RepID=F0ZDP7_DICPU|nr:uncharacterized protein DICPUDRAFT_149424 [Dictyostelium purpureum]EGC37971.1 hypothetical protein DICPUDRAFT_149424 [Dictyostelium purpureum]|eukprot:XP_003285542.1 hypothetical protein DICPUDRAFT_149424 [Dictyostelium purpureum]